MRPYRIYGVQDVATAWGLTPERIRQLLKEGKLSPDYRCQSPSGARDNYYWAEIPPKRHWL